MDTYAHETKDQGIVHFQGSPDSYNPNTDPGFVELGRATYSDTSTLTGDDSGIQQSIFDRLPLSQSNRREFYDWLLKEHQNSEAQVKEPNAKKRRRCPQQDMEM